MSETDDLKKRVAELEAALVRAQAQMNNAAMAMHNLVGEMIRSATDAGRVADPPISGHTRSTWSGLHPENEERRFMFEIERTDRYEVIELSDGKRWAQIFATKRWYGPFDTESEVRSFVEGIPNMERTAESTQQN